MPRPLTNIAILLVLTLGLVYANSTLKTENDHVHSNINYKNMTTTELQIAVEKLSNEGKLPKEMGFELMKRWQTETSTTY